MLIRINLCAFCSQNVDKVFDDSLILLALLELGGGNVSNVCTDFDTLALEFYSDTCTAASTYLQRIMSLEGFALLSSMEYPRPLTPPFV
jgi:hypothetical protein